MLSQQEKDFLREAICYGAFSDNQSRVISKDVLTKVAGMTDDAVRVVLTKFKNDRVARSSASLSMLQSQIVKAQANLAQANAITIGTPTA